MVTATFRFYEELNDFLAPDRRGHEFTTHCALYATAKHMIEALGVPHTEAKSVLVNGESMGFERALADGDRVAVYPKFESLDITPLLRVRAQPLRKTRFVADAHLAGLAHLLRMTGFDTLYENHFNDGEIGRLAHTQRRIVLTRDRELLKRRKHYVRPPHAEPQLREVFERLDAARPARPVTRRLNCNGPLHAVEKAQIEMLLPPRVGERHERVSSSDDCARNFWEGSHWCRMRELLDTLLGRERLAHSAMQFAEQYEISMHRRELSS